MEDYINDKHTREYFYELVLTAPMLEELLHHTSQTRGSLQLPGYQQANKTIHEILSEYFKDKTIIQMAVSTEVSRNNVR
jgi:hypothetical protein